MGWICEWGVFGKLVLVFGLCSGYVKTMAEKIDEKVSVNLAFDSKASKVYPKWVVWSGRLYPITHLGLHHTYKKGATLYHVFSVVSRTLFLRLVLDTSNLHWKLTEVSSYE